MVSPSGLATIIYPEPFLNASISTANLPAITKYSSAGAVVTVYTGNTITVDNFAGVNRIKIGITIAADQLVQGSGGIVKVVL
jgi:hypothetical protein